MKKTKKILTVALCVLACLLMAMTVYANGGKRCPRCGGRDFRFSSKAALCSLSGKNTYTCKKCGYSKSTVIPKKPHVYVTRTVIHATCTKKGLCNEICSQCGNIRKQIVIPKKSHNYAVSKILKENSRDYSTLRTYREKRCKNCGYVVKEILNTHYHNWKWNKSRKCYTCTCGNIKRAVA